MSDWPPDTSRRDRIIRIVVYVTVVAMIIPLGLGLVNVFTG